MARPARAALAMWIGAACAVSLSAGCDASSPSESTARNVLLLSVDTWRGDHLLGERGAVALTPRLAGFAERSMLFTDASSAANATSPGVTGLLTGLLPRRAGVVQNGHRLQPEIPTLASMLRSRGFETAAFVANPILASEHGFARGYARYELASRTRRQKSGYADALTESAIAWLEEQPDDGRYLLWVHYMDPHGPYEPPQRYRALFDAEQFAGTTDVPHQPVGRHDGHGGIPKYQQVPYDGEAPSRDAREYAARYAAEVRFVDDAIGFLLETMEARGWLDETVVVLTSDHGEALAGDHGYWFSHGHGLTRDQVHVPLLLYCDRCDAARIDRPVSTIDVVPTVLELLDIAPPKELDGKSLLRSHPGPVIAQAPDATTVRRGRWKLSLGSGQQPTLIDLANDADEQRNVAGEHADVVFALTAEMRAVSRPPLARPEPRDALGPEELQSLRVLGYVE